jgi:hypothetical protein
MMPMRNWIKIPPANKADGAAKRRSRALAVTRVRRRPTPSTQGGQSENYGMWTREHLLC